MHNYRFISNIIIFLSLLILIMLGYVFYYKKFELIKLSELNSRTIIFSIYKHKLENLTKTVEQFESEEPEEYTESIDTQIDWQKQPIITILLEDIEIMNSKTSSLPAEIGFIQTIQDQKIDDAYKMHDILYSIPLEIGDVSEDESYLLSNLTKEENVHRLKFQLDQLKDNQILYTAKNEIFTDNADNAELLISMLKNKNAICLSGKINKDAIIYKIAEKNSFDILRNDVILDAKLSRELIAENLLKLEEVAKTQGHAMAIASAYPLTIELILKWISTAEEKGIKIVSVHDFYAIIKKRRTLKDQKLGTD